MTQKDNVSRKQNKSYVMGCSRCGRNHDVEFFEFTNQIVLDSGEKFTHWGMCPFLGEPIIMKMTDSVLLYGGIGVAP